MFRGSLILVLLCLLACPQVCSAAVSLSVNPVDGSNSLRFQRAPISGMGNDEEIHIRVSSSNGSRYQVFQRILEPILNEKGESLNLQAIETQTLANSNASGTLYLQNTDRMSISDQLVYSSSLNGESDSFIIRYSLNRNLINASGNFRGRLVFTVRGSGNGPNDQVTIDVIIETSSSLKFAIKGAHDPNRIRIVASDTARKSADYINVSFSGNLGQEVRIYQQVDSFPQNEMDEPLGQNVLQLNIQGETEGLRMSGPSPLRTSRTLVYSGNKDEDSFLVYFLTNADEVQQQDAGSYVGKIKYVMETDQGTQELPINIQCDIPPIFTMNVKIPPGGVKFMHVLAGSPPQDEEVDVTVISNIHKPYQVTQDLQTGMTNKQGKEFDSKYFTLQVEVPPGQKGQTNFTEFLPVQTGEYPVFSSDASGSGATFKVLYRLQGYAQMNPGDFLVPIRFSLDQK